MLSIFNLKQKLLIVFLVFALITSMTYVLANETEQKPQAGFFDDSLDKNKVIVKSNVFGNISDIAEIDLKTIPQYDSKKKQEVYKVVRGGEVNVLEFEANVFKDSSGAVADLEWLDMRTNKTFTKEYVYKVKKTRLINISNIPVICDKLYVNGSVHCYDGNATTQQVEETYYEPIKTLDLLKGKNTLAVFTEVLKGDYFDVIPNLFNLKVSKWVIVLEDALLDSYWSFNETSGTTAVDSIFPQNNITVTSGWRFANGKNGYALNITAAARNGVDTGINLGGRSAVSLSAWVYRYGDFNPSSQASSLYGLDSGAYEVGGFQLSSANCPGQATDFALEFRDSGGTKGVGNCTNIPKDQWTHIVIVMNASNMMIYKNGSLVVNNAASNFAFRSDVNLRFFSDISNTNRLANTIVDEVGLWNRSLDSSEVTELNNNHAGFFPPFATATALNLSLVYPQNTSYNYANRPTTINATFQNSTDLNVCLYSTNNGATNTTLTCGTNATGQNASQGSNTWLFAMNQTDGTLNVSKVTFFYDGIAPNVSIVYPQNTSYTTNITALNYTCSDGQNAWYSLNAGATNSSHVACGTNFTNILTSIGSNTIHLFVNDSFNNINSTSVTFQRLSSDSIAPTINLTTPTAEQLGVLQFEMPFTLSFIAEVNDTYLQSIWYGVERDGAVYVANTTTNGNFSVVFDTFSSYIVKISANDTSGNLYVLQKGLNIFKQAQSGSAAGISFFDVPTQNKTSTQVQSIEKQSFRKWFEKQTQKYGGLMIVGFIIVLALYGKRFKK